MLESTLKTKRQVVINLIDDAIMSRINCLISGDSLVFEDLKTSEIENIVAALIEEDDRSLECIYGKGNEGEAELATWVIKLMNGKKSPLTQWDFISTLRANVFSYYKPRIQELLDEQVHWILSNEYALAIQQQGGWDDEYQYGEL